MNTGQYYYDQMPLYYRRQFKKEYKRQRADFNRLMKEEFTSHYWFIHQIPEWGKSKKGESFWINVSLLKYTQLDLNRPFAKWFRKSTLVAFINKHAVPMVTLFFLFAIVCVCVLFMAIEKQKQDKEILKNELSRRDSINLINRANHIVDSTNAANAVYYPWSPKGAITTDSVNSWMDRIMSENKIPGK